MAHRQGNHGLRHGKRPSGLTELEKSVYHLALQLGKTVSEVRRMPYEEYQGWALFFASQQPQSNNLLDDNSKLLEALIT